MTNQQKVKHAVAVLRELEHRYYECACVNEIPIQSLVDLYTLLEKPHVTDGVKGKAKEVPKAAHTLVEKLLHLILKRKRNFRAPDLDKWAVDMDKILRLDKRTPEQLEAVIEWSQQDDFWQNNVLSPSKLRKQLDRLELQMSRDHKWLRNRKVVATRTGKSAKEKYMEAQNDSNL